MMIYYFLPGNGVFGGIKVAYQFVDALISLGRPAAIAAPEGLAATWLESHAPVVDRDSCLAHWRDEDTAIFSLPHDYPSVTSVASRVVFHCQGTDPLIDPVLADERITILTCWEQARAYAEERGRPSVEVGISVSDRFFHGGEPKVPGSIAYLPRRGADFAEAVLRDLPGVHAIGLDGLAEWDLAAELRQASFFLASARGEWFGLPALEAMASGCLVLSAPVLGGREYLHDGVNAVVGEVDRLRSALASLAADERGPEATRMRLAGLATAHRYSVAAQRVTLARTLAEGWLDD